MQQPDEDPDEAAQCPERKREGGQHEEQQRSRRAYRPDGPGQGSDRQRLGRQCCEDDSHRRHDPLRAERPEADDRPEAEQRGADRIQADEQVGAHAGETATDVRRVRAAPRTTPPAGAASPSLSGIPRPQ